MKTMFADEYAIGTCLASRSGYVGLGTVLE